MIICPDRKHEENVPQATQHLENIPEDVDRTITRSVYKVSQNIPILFDSERRARKERIVEFSKLLEKTENVSSKSDPALYAMRFVISMINKQTQEDIELINIIEALALNQIETRKDLIRLIKAKNNRKDFDKVIKEFNEREKNDDEFLKTHKPYIKRFKDFLDHEAEDREV